MPDNLWGKLALFVWFIIVLRQRPAPDVVGSARTSYLLLVLALLVPLTAVVIAAWQYLRTPDPLPALVRAFTVITLGLMVMPFSLVLALPPEHLTAAPHLVVALSALLGLLLVPLNLLVDILPPSLLAAGVGLPALPPHRQLTLSRVLFASTLIEIGAAFMLYWLLG